jgi:radical S-adenosyl methionine domain-containing protein 2
MTLKINSVISRLNYSEDFTAFIRAAAPDRWKLLKMKTFQNSHFDNSPLEISDARFNAFVLRHRAVPHIVERIMTNAYIMVDAFGNLVDTGSYDNAPVANLLCESFSKSFSRLNFDYDTYQARYIV